MAWAEYEGGYGNIKYTTAMWIKDPSEKWWIGICNYCNDPVLILNQGVRIYPHPLPSPTDTKIPEKIRKDLMEAKFCFSVNTFRACAVMARRSIQAACIDKGARKEKLVDQLQELKSNGTITNDLLEWANVVRWVGNDAAHPNGDEVRKEDSEDILKLAEQFLHVLYVAPAIAMERRKIKKA